MIKLQEKTNGQTDTGAGPEQMYEEVGEGLAAGSGRGQRLEAQQMYEEVSHREVKVETDTKQSEELMHYD